MSHAGVVMSRSMGREELQTKGLAIDGNLN